jgi:hypothetical protein
MISDFLAAIFEWAGLRALTLAAAAWSASQESLVGWSAARPSARSAAAHLPVDWQERRAVQTAASREARAAAPVPGWGRPGSAPDVVG